MPFLEIDILSGTFSLILIAIYVYVGMRIMLRYFKVKQRVFLLVGITWIILSSPWWGSALSFLVGLTNDGVGLQNGGEQTYFLVVVMCMPAGIIVWMIAFTDLLYKDQQKLIVAIFTLFVTSFMVVFLLLNYGTPNGEAVGSLASATDVTFKPIIMLFLLTVILIVLVSGNLFARESIRSDNPEIKLKGKLLRTAFILFCVGALFDSALPFDRMPFLLPVTRIIMIISAICFYGGFLLPNWMKPKSIRE